MILVKDGKIYLDGTLTEAEKEEIVFKEYEHLQSLLDKYHIKNLDELEHVIINEGTNEAAAQEHYEYVEKPLENKSKVLEIIKKKHINVGTFQLKVGSGYKFSTYEQYWNAWGYSPFTHGTDVSEKRLTKKEWNKLCEELIWK